MDNTGEEPELIETQNGSSVFFQGRLLYSKFNPKKNIQCQIEAIKFQPHTLVVLSAPVLDYGITEILQVLPAPSYLLAIQTNDTLYRFSKMRHGEKYFQAFTAQAQNFSFVYAKTCNEILNIVTQLDIHYDFKRLVFINASSFAASDTDQKNFFASVKTQLELYLKKKAINQLTLITMGHGFAANFFKNLHYLCNSAEKNTVKSIFELSVHKPILIIAAGTSLDSNISEIIKAREKFFIIAVDAVAAALSKICTPDAIVILESQIFIAPAFIAYSNYHTKKRTRKKPILFADISSAPQVIKNFSGQPYFYFTDYAAAKFLRRFYALGYFSEKYTSVGSVGLSAVQIAISIRANQDIPIFITGLDFSYQVPFTHSRYSFQTTHRFSSCQKLNPLFAAESFFGKTIMQLEQNGKTIYSVQNLLSYRHIFQSLLQSEKNIHLLPSFAHDQTISFHNALVLATQTPVPPICSERIDNKKTLDDLRNFLSETKNDLDDIRSCLIGTVHKSNTELLELLSKNDFLFLHFPDYSPACPGRILEQHFLKRIRIEVEYFLKFLN